MSKQRRIKHERAVRSRIMRATNREQHEKIRNFLLKEMPQEWQLPDIPNTPNIEDRGYLVGCWQKNTLIAAAFVTPPEREAEELLTRNLGEQDAYTWMKTQGALIHYIKTSPHKRRQGIALDTVRYIRTQAVKHSQRYIIAVASNPAAARLFHKAGYRIYPPSISLALQRKGNTFGVLPGALDVCYAVMEISPSDGYTITGCTLE